MLKNFRKNLRSAINERQQADFPGMSRIIPFVIIFTLLYCIFAVYVVPSDKPADFNFLEGGTMTALSAIYLTLACGFAIGANLVYKRAEGSQQWIWTIIAAGFAFLAFDELLQFHERFGRIVVEQIIPQTVFRNWNDVIVILYGVAALPLMLLMLPGLMKYKKVLELFATAFIFYVIHTFIDSTQEPPTLTSIILEESAKLFSVAFLAMGSLAGFIGNIWKYSEVSADNQLENNPAVKEMPVVSFDMEAIKFSK